ncbi:MAG: hypothetical protein NZ934_03160 [Hadesarchaea archaeon]|nr:hypothetical protein [Hadesarchaea archaeon]
MSGRKVALAELLRIISLCQSVRLKGLDPFEVDVRKKLEVLRKYLPRWKAIDELLLDAEAFNELSTVIKLQGDWLKRQAAMLYVDPELVEAKLRLLEAGELARCLLVAWRPLMVLEQITPQRLQEAIDYWNALPPLRERMRMEEVAETPLGAVPFSELLRFKFVSTAELQGRIEELHRQLKERARLGKVDYWDFVVQDTYEKSVERAYYVAFMVSQGLATLELDPLTEGIYLKPLEGKAAPASSMPIAFTYERWRERRPREHGRGG